MECLTACPRRCSQQNHWESIPARKCNRENCADGRRLCCSCGRPSRCLEDELAVINLPTVAGLGVMVSRDDDVPARFNWEGCRVVYSIALVSFAVSNQSSLHRSEFELFRLHYNIQEDLDTDESKKSRIRHGAVQHLVRTRHSNCSVRRLLPRNAAVNINYPHIVFGSPLLTMYTAS